jgi:tetrahydromethanopterin S-methyltransferase subunit G
MPKAKGFVVAPGKTPIEVEEEVPEAAASTPEPQPITISLDEIANQINQIQARLDLLEKTVQDIQAQLAKTRA